MQHWVRFKCLASPLGLLDWLTLQLKGLHRVIHVDSSNQRGINLWFSWILSQALCKMLFTISNWNLLSELLYQHEQSSTIISTKHGLSSNPSFMEGRPRMLLTGLKTDSLHQKIVHQTLEIRLWSLLTGRLSSVRCKTMVCGTTPVNYLLLIPMGLTWHGKQGMTYRIVANTPNVKWTMCLTNLQSAGWVADWCREVLIQLTVKSVEIASHMMDQLLYSRVGSPNILSTLL